MSGSGRPRPSADGGGSTTGKTTTTTTTTTGTGTGTGTGEGSGRRLCMAKTAKNKACLLPESLRWRDGYCSVHSPNQLEHEEAAARAKELAKKKLTTSRETYAAQRSYSSDSDLSASQCAGDPAAAAAALAEAGLSTGSLDAGFGLGSASLQAGSSSTSFGNGVVVVSSGSLGEGSSADEAGLATTVPALLQRTGASTASIDSDDVVIMRMTGGMAGVDDGSSLAAKRNLPPLAVDTAAPASVLSDSPSIDSPLATPQLAYSRREKVGIAGGDDHVSWRGSLSIVLDLDETLVAAQEGHPDMPLEMHDTHQIFLDDDHTEPMTIAVRPWATRFLWYLNEEGFEVYVLTAGSQSYCTAVVELLNSLLDKPVILAGASCRDQFGRVQAKRFEQVLPPYVLPAFAIGVDNKRAAFHEKYQSQVIVVADYLPSWPHSVAQTVLMDVLNTALHIAYHFERHYARTGTFKPTGAILSGIYEEREKERMASQAHSFAFTHPQDTGGPDSFLAFLRAREA
ncbi:uncharacterized protein AMSG_08344 [Thecamonas trahens ATCC 50062]|uniref:FCP1 homology domain-containing protein n=1 Tax=Thecamonas trahens ATCC 50062 TaxID=461836 RepID=A0A0L0DLV7_THETB|nr:hypothetical protein AMSG_08344 [Thecamonas trahens ATCC 50062]KNC52373.1 hypothetical protein AMSG_08344 [Thecamonas trahens ATCC 50062]|eukprot:XP_013755420.1 hypothetical protein AMSG_08344 [Thecamonas trahens ATCC 50062]